MKTSTFVFNQFAPPAIGDLRLWREKDDWFVITMWEGKWIGGLSGTAEFLGLTQAQFDDARTSSKPMFGAGLAQ